VQINTQAVFDKALTNHTGANGMFGDKGAKVHSLFLDLKINKLTVMV
jgi:hypothetical protein